MKITRPTALAAIDTTYGSTDGFITALVRDIKDDDIDKIIKDF